MGRTANQRKVPKMAAIKLQVRITKYLMCLYGGHMCKCIPNVKLLCLTLCQGEVCTDDDADDDVCQTKHDYIRFFSR